MLRTRGGVQGPLGGDTARAGVDLAPIRGGAWQSSSYARVLAWRRRCDARVGLCLDMGRCGTPCGSPCTALRSGCKRSSGDSVRAATAPRGAYGGCPRPMRAHVASAPKLVRSGAGRVVFLVFGCLCAAGGQLAPLRGTERERGAGLARRSLAQSQKFWEGPVCAAGDSRSRRERSIALVGAVMTAWGLAWRELAVGHVVFWRQGSGERH